MPHIPMIDYATAPDHIREAHDEEIRLRGRMTNMKRTLLHSPQAHRIYAEWFTLREELLPAVDDRAIQVFCKAISEEVGSKIAVTFFRRALIQSGADPDALELREEDRLLNDFGRAIVRNSKDIPPDIWAALKIRYQNKTLVDLVALAGIMLATAVFNNVVEVPFDAELEPFAAPD
ncbi:hypothetical protein [Rhizobium rhizoryzae]|uniref:Carboxymuconolactone decarboxylase family protein n=1 Tax=Rhizobium rhizoryzae TaxID=451876 RepID=A0A7W6PSL9_9HYPH|nr:hypothetical protein [Rhizobium rhizoryzae]MBB4145124.1 hypothetical protein [Rhizobium rhizoryzae]